MMLFTLCQDLMLAFIALETFSLAMYVLAGFNKAWHGNREAALKYFLLGAFAAAFFLLGLALVFGTTASVNLADISATFNLAGLARRAPAPAGRRRAPGACAPLPSRWAWPPSTSGCPTSMRAPPPR